MVCHELRTAAVDNSKAVCCVRKIDIVLLEIRLFACIPLPILSLKRVAYLNAPIQTALVGAS